MNLKLKHFHVIAPKPRRCTLAISVPSRQDLLIMLNNFFVHGINPVGFDGEFGISKVHPKDNYNHRTGRKNSLDNKQEAFYYLIAIERIANGTVFKFQVTNKEKNVGLLRQVNFLIQPASNVVHIQFVDCTNIKRI